MCINKVIGVIFLFWAFLMIPAGADPFNSRPMPVKKRICEDNKVSYFGVCPEDSRPDSDPDSDPAENQTHTSASSNVDGYLKIMSSKADDSSPKLLGILAIIDSPLYLPLASVSDGTGSNFFKNGPFLANDDPSLYGNPDSKIATAINLDSERKHLVHAQK